MSSKMKQESARPSKREQLIQTAVTLFAQNGIHPTGIDTIVEHSGVTQKPCMRTAAQKEELVLAALRHYDGQFRNSFMRQVETKARTPKTRLLGIFDVAETWFLQQSFYGCLFINAVGEHSTPDTSLRYDCGDFKRMMTEFTLKLCIQMGARNPQHLAEELSLLLEGAIVTAQVSQKPEAAKIAKRVAAALIEKQSPHETPQT